MFAHVASPRTECDQTVTLSALPSMGLQVLLFLTPATHGRDTTDPSHPRTRATSSLTSLRASPHTGQIREDTDGVCGALIVCQAWAKWLTRLSSFNAHNNHVK